MLNRSYLNTKGLKAVISGYLKGVDLSCVDDAWKLAIDSHQDRRHFSGESYVIHLLEVALVLASMRLDLDTVLAGLLHGVKKEGVTSEQLTKLFGEGVARMVDGSTKITRVQYNSKLAHQAQNLRKMLLAMATDVRVLLVKLADRLVDMQLLDMVDREQQIYIARETQDVYAPLASRLGIDWMKRELEDYSFKYLYPEDYERLNEELESSLDERQNYVDEVLKILHEKLGENGITPIRIIGRPKHLYSIYKKLVAQKIKLEQVFDKVAFRIIVESVHECYEALGTIHANWAPVPGRIKDFISVPKANNYQSMHTTVVGPHGEFIEIQIRTEEMDKVAQEGVAAHWAYKEGQKVNPNDAKLFRELKKLVASLQEVEDPREFLDSLIGELYDPEVYALTPNGEVKEFPLGSCPIDFAYSIHTEVGDHCVAAKINGRQVPLKYQLQTGDMVEIVTSPSQVPRRGWLDLVKTSRARTRIRAWLRREEKERAIKLGREICEREIRKNNTSLKRIVKSGQIRPLLKHLRCNSLEDLLAKVGNGAISIQNLVKALKPDETRGETDVPVKVEPTPEELAEMLVQPHVGGEKQEAAGISIDGINGMLVKISQCCRPVPGDPIVGFITMGRGVSIHTADCANLRSTDPMRRIDVTWGAIAQKNYKVSIFVRAENRKGTFAEISGAISLEDANIADISAHTTATDQAEMNIAVEVVDLEHLNRLLRHLRQLPAVITAERQ